MAQTSDNLLPQLHLWLVIQNQNIPKPLVLENIARIANGVQVRGMSFRVFSVNFCEGFITKFGDESSKSPNLVNNPSLNLVTNLWLTESGEKSITKLGDEFLDRRILCLNWWISLWQTYYAFDDDYCGRVCTVFSALLTEQRNFLLIFTLNLVTK